MADSRRKRPEPKRVELALEKDTRLSMNLHRPAEAVTITPSDRFVILPGGKGKGWVLVIYSD